MRTPGARWLGVAVSVLLLGAACRGTEAGGGSGGAGEPQEVGTIQIGGQSANDHGEVDVSGMTSVEVEVDDFYFEPTVLSGEAGQVLTVELTNEGDAPHTFTSDPLGIDVELQSGDRGEAEVTLPDSGAVMFLCRFHAGRGMRGALSVGGDLTVQGSAGSDDSGRGGYDPY